MWTKLGRRKVGQQRMRDKKPAKLKCWICRAPATTDEHKLKRSLVTAINGVGPYQGSSAMAHVRAGRVRQLQGPDSKLIKYEDLLCDRCNNERTQPFDRAYDAFTNFVLTHEAELVARRVIDLAEVYGVNGWNGRHADLYKYFVKMFGSHLVTCGMPVPRLLVWLLNRDRFVTKLRLYFSVNEDKLLFPKVSDRSIGIGGMVTTRRNLKSRKDAHYFWSHYFSFLHIYFLYDWTADGPMGAPWTADNRFIYMGWEAPLTADQRAQLREQL